MKKIILILLLCSHVILQGEVILIFGGKSGWIGGLLMQHLEQNGHTVFAAHSRLENRQSIEQEVILTNPDRIINAAGITGRPNVDWCEKNKIETIRANLLGPLILADIANKHGIHLTNISTGCIYSYDDKHPLGSGIAFTEEDEPNFTGSFYSECKVALEKIIKHYQNVLHLRLRMPISDTLTERAFVGKIIKYKKLINIPNSMAVIDDMLPAITTLCLRKKTGIYNLVNPGTISHHEIIHLYQKYIDPHHIFENVNEEELNQELKAPRSNCELSTKKLLIECPNIPHIQESIIKVFERMSQKILNKKDFE